jgi:hypothetical protein
MIHWIGAPINHFPAGWVVTNVTSSALTNPTLPHASASRKQNNLPEGAWFQDFLMSAAGFRKRQLFAYDRPQGAILQAGENPSMNFLFFGLRGSPQRKGKN